VTDVLGKTFIEPEIIPPLHGDKIAKPMMSQLMDNGVAKGEHALIGNPVLKEIQIIKGDNTGIFHGAPLVLMGKDLIILGKGVGTAEIFLEELKGLVGHLLNVGSEFGELGFEGLDAVETHREVVVSIAAGEFFVWADNETVEVGWKEGGFVEGS
jgi:hypothetical protein